jgi:hypothetical protein
MIPKSRNRFSEKIMRKQKSSQQPGLDLKTMKGVEGHDER